MTEREKFIIAEMKQKLYYQRQGTCEVCGKVIPMHCAQLAHRVPKHKKYIKRFGKDFIHSPYNLALVCSLKCNSAVLLDPATQPIEADKLFSEFIEKLR